MKRFLIALCVILLAVMVFASDKISFIELTVGTTPIKVYFRHSAMREITIVNDDSTNYLILDWGSLVPTSLTLTDGVTTEGSAVFTSATADFITNGAEKGDLIWLHKGDANDGVYEIVSVDSETQITLSKALAVTATITNFDVHDWRIKSGESQTYKLHGIQFSLKASAASTGVRIYVKSAVSW